MYRYTLYTRCQTGHTCTYLQINPVLAVPDRTHLYPGVSFTYVQVYPVHTVSDRTHLYPGFVARCVLYLSTGTPGTLVARQDTPVPRCVHLQVHPVHTLPDRTHLYLGVSCTYLQIYPVHTVPDRTHLYLSTDEPCRATL